MSVAIKIGHGHSKQTDFEVDVRRGLEIDRRTTVDGISWLSKKEEDAEQGQWESLI